MSDMSLSPFRGQQTAEEILEPSPLSKLRRRIQKSQLPDRRRDFDFDPVVRAAGTSAGPHDPYDQDLARRLINPFWHDKKTDEAFLLGTDKIGPRLPVAVDLRCADFAAYRVQPTILISGVIGTALGVTAGYFGGRVDMVVNFIINTRLAMPVFLVAMAAVVAFGASLHVVILVLGLFLWDRFAPPLVRSITSRRRFGLCDGEPASWRPTPYIIIREPPRRQPTLTVVAAAQVANAAA